MIEDERRRGAWISIFRRKGRDGKYTHVFEDLSNADKEHIYKALKLREDEFPIVAIFRDDSDWFAITTRRLVWYSNEIYSELTVDLIAYVGIDRSNLPPLGSSSQIRSLVVRTLLGEERTIEGEPGEPINGVWNILSNAVTRNMNSPRI